MICMKLCHNVIIWGHWRLKYTELQWSTVSTDGFHTTSSWILRFSPFFFIFLLSLYHIQYAKCTIKQIYKSKHLCNGSGCGGSVERLERWGRSLSSWSRSTQAKKSGEIIIIIINTVINHGHFHFHNYCHCHHQHDNQARPGCQCCSGNLIHWREAE